MPLHGSSIACGVILGAVASCIALWLAQSGSCSPGADNCAACLGQHMQQHAALAPQPCDYGLLAGYWTWSLTYGPGSRWQTVYQPCQLQNLLMPPAGATTSLLLLGDSVDLHLAQEYAGALNGSLQPALPKGGKRNRNVLYTAHIPADPATGRGQLQLGMRHLLGVHPTGPYHANETGSYKVRIPTALAEFKVKFKRDPDMVLLSSNMWDQARMWTRRDHLHGVANKLLPEAVHSWAVNFTQVLQAAAATFPKVGVVRESVTAWCSSDTATVSWQQRDSQAYVCIHRCSPASPTTQAASCGPTCLDRGAFHRHAVPVAPGRAVTCLPPVCLCHYMRLALIFPAHTHLAHLVLRPVPHPQGTLLAYHTTARPSPAANWLGNPHYVEQLNEAGVQVARQLGWAVVDLDGMVAGLPYEQYLSDLHHPR